MKIQLVFTLTFALSLSLQAQTPAGTEAAKTEVKAEEEKAKESPAPEAAEKSEKVEAAATAPDAPALPNDKVADEPVAQKTPSVDLEKMRADLKKEIAAELREQMQAELESAAKDAANQRAAKLEWEEEKWVEEVKPRLNFLEFNGYFRSRFDYYNNLSLGTYDPIRQRGTSSVAPPTFYRPFNGEDCPDDGLVEGYPCSPNAEDNQSMTSFNMRLRLDPTLNVSEDIRIRTTVDVFDNLVLGSTPRALSADAPFSLLSDSQLTPENGFNTAVDAIRFKRVWAEVDTPIGQLRVGRQPQNFGMGLLLNDGNGFDQDYGDSADQIQFTTTVPGVDMVITPSYSITSSGATGRGGVIDANTAFGRGEDGQRYNLDPRDDIHNFQITLLKRDKEEDVQARLRDGDLVFNYGAYFSWKTQALDNPAAFAGNGQEPNEASIDDNFVSRNANAFSLSGWARLNWGKLRLEAEAVGFYASVDGTSLTSSSDPAARDTRLDALDEEGVVIAQDLLALQGGFAFESDYRLLNDSLVIGLDFGIASGDDAPGFGLRPGTNSDPEQGDFDGEQYGECLERGTDVNGDDACASVDNNITNFRFDPNFNIDLILFREVLGTVTDALYVKPHVSYFVTEDLGVRADLIWSNAIFGSSTPGLSNPLGVELDATGFYKSDDGFFIMLQGGAMVPLAGLGHARDSGNDELGKEFRDGTRVSPVFLNPSFAWTVQAFAGVQF